jgi:ABC-type Zn uptake system ZnuABC Zn-binding protein ZnuA
MGLGLDNTSAEKMKSGSGNANLKIVAFGDQIPEELRLEGTCNHAHEPGQAHEHGDDPHMWLDPDYAVRMVEMIRDELKAKDPAHATGYDSRATAYIAKLKKLKEDGVAMLKGQQKPRLVTFHDSLAYFEKSFGLNVRGVLTKKPGQEPEPNEMKKLIKICSNPDNPVRVIATEPQYSTSNSAETLRKELATSGVKDVILVEFDPLETVRPDELTADWYERKMRANLETLSKAFKK